MDKKRSREDSDTHYSTKEKKVRLDPRISQTLYIQNLNDKISPETTRANLYLLCTSFGDVIDIIIKPKSKRMRGQAHVVFSNITEAQVALTRLQEQKFFGKSIKAAFAHKKSKLIKRIELHDQQEEV
ncbi:hypothetical protein PSN45_001138 [Yamadazyma tenuis]|uniref:RRM domain-containing protein n=1 Tax=Candida tenuis (strain ATCC 10573 / BCRC 21748 / CBS 615 / JCM 9827 / NBRC 10315 / NRRL Y-1498 / VKM Y-70) TaxID=590646 RepID=G3B8H9_CANTC|nr:uncharacterized protein CANTEDRAFT_109340 [Yamadazyma tenuis ATCC 10573]EGV62400.1 hypothetical protein CANTEDRAFT_109340 [Yamadazyma tenuis ATCC 10573]WEJ93666.1 hypothetical protein PSN45_001138 [Yamadazyma tenuis]